jgi:polysaccharide biosynthesis/export protein
MGETGEVEQQVIDLSNLVDTYQVQDGDVVVVPKTDTGSVLDFAQRLLGPLGLLFGIF